MFDFRCPFDRSKTCSTRQKLALLEVLDVLEKIDDTDAKTTGEGVSIPKAKKETDDGEGQHHRKLSYGEFVAGRRPLQIAEFLQRLLERAAPIG